MINCFKCNKELEIESHCLLQDRPNGLGIGIVYGGLICRCRGNYGSTIFDPFPGDKLQWFDIYVCDSCMMETVKRFEGMV